MAMVGIENGLEVPMVGGQSAEVHMTIVSMPFARYEKEMKKWVDEEDVVVDATAARFSAIRTALQRMFGEDDPICDDPEVLAGLTVFGQTDVRKEEETLRWEPQQRKKKQKKKVGWVPDVEWDVGKMGPLRGMLMYKPDTEVA